jgi:hypothetical protein
MNPEDDKDENMSRRNFLKKMGVGAAGLGAFSMLPASAVNVRSSSLKFFGTDDSAEFNIGDGGPINMNTNVDMSSANKVTLPQVSGSPSSTSVGDMWYDTDADSS